jgi:hypothetical protein
MVKREKEFWSFVLTRAYDKKSIIRMSAIQYDHQDILIGLQTPYLVAREDVPIGNCVLMGVFSLITVHQ